VLGAGPAGSATALLLGRRGYDVRLLERSPFPRNKPCGDFLTPGAIRILRDELGVLQKLMQSGAVALARETIVGHDGQILEGNAEALSCPRSVTDATLVNAAVSAGARFVTGCRAREVIFDGGRVTGVRCIDPGGSQTIYKARVTVGADGARSLLARSMRVVRPIPRLHRLAIVGRFSGAEATQGVSPGVTLHLAADGSRACCGIGAACGPEGALNANIVVPVAEARQMAGRLDDYFEGKMRSAFPLAWAQIGTLRRIGALQSVGCFGHWTTHAAADGAILVGDAAMFVHPFTGEGVYFALRGAELAAKTIDKAFKNGGATAYAGLSGYDRARRRELAPRYRLCDSVQRVVHSPAAMEWAAHRLRRSPKLLNELLMAVGDVTRPAALWKWENLRRAL
jgi:flavin-dependent dehydrogenase